jgi:hypothetical protein
MYHDGGERGKEIGREGRREVMDRRKSTFS